MKYFFLILSGFLFLIPTAHAQDLFDFGEQETLENSLFPDEGEEEKARDEKTELINAFYENCLSTHQAIGMEDYAAEQCACTAAEMADFMTLRDLEAVLGNNISERETQSARLYTLGYVPCLEATIANFIYDGCIEDPNIRAEVEKQPEFCTCLGNAMGRFTKDIADVFKSQQFDPKNQRGRFIPPNPMNYYMSLRTFQIEKQYSTRTCLLKHDP